LVLCPSYQFSLWQKIRLIWCNEDYIGMLTNSNLFPVPYNFSIFLHRLLALDHLDQSHLLRSDKPFASVLVTYIVKVLLGILLTLTIDNLLHKILYRWHQYWYIEVHTPFFLVTAH